MDFKKVSKEIFEPVKENKKIFEENFKDKLSEIFPSAVKDGQVDFKALLEELGEYVDTKERYELTWAGKQNAKKKANEDIVGRTLKYVPEDSKNPESTENLYIEGDNLEVLKLLRNSYYNKIKMIYIDPPYNTGNDFIYNDDFSQSEKETEIEEGDISENERFVVNQKSTGKFHSNWLNMMYPRLKVAKDLLSEEGVIFISIDNNEIANLRRICDEVFDEGNFVDCITWNKRVPKNDNKGIGNIHEYILVYVNSTNNKRQFVMRKEGLKDIYELLKSFKVKKVSIQEAEAELKRFYKKKGYDRGITLYNNLDKNYEPWGKINMSWPNGDTFGPTYDVFHPKTGKPTKVPDRGWRWNQTTFSNKLDYNNVIERYDGSFICGQIWFAKDENTQPSYIKYLRDVDKMLLRSIISTKSDGGMEVEKLFEGKSYFPYPKPMSLIKMLIDSLYEKEGIYLDFFAGSATTAHAVMQLNAEDGGKRKFIMVQLPEEIDEKSEAFKVGFKNICEIGKERIRRAGEKILKENKDKEGIENLDFGFKVFKTSDTNIRWFSEAIRGSLTPLEETTTDKDKLDFNDRFTDIDVVYEILLRHRDIPLSSKVENLKEIGKRTYMFADAVVVCLETEITEEIVDKIAAIEPMPIKIIFRDSAFGDNISLKENTMIRLEAQIKKNSGIMKKSYRIEFI